MQHDLAERRIKGLQKEFFTKVEQHPVFMVMDPDAFNELRKSVFRGTFEAYRLGVLGVDTEQSYNDLYRSFFGWLPNTEYLTNNLQIELARMCFRTALEAFRIGAMVAVDREERR